MLILLVRDRLYTSESDVYRRKGYFIFNILYWGRKVCLSINICTCFVSNFHFHPFEFLGRGSETQLLVGEIFFYSNVLRAKVKATD